MAKTSRIQDGSDLDREVRYAMNFDLAEQARLEADRPRTRIPTLPEEGDFEPFLQLAVVLNKTLDLIGLPGVNQPSDHMATLGTLNLMPTVTARWWRLTQD